MILNVKMPTFLPKKALYVQSLAPVPSWQIKIEGGNELQPNEI